MPRFLNHVNLLGYQLQNAVVHPLAADPVSPNVAQIWFNTSAGADAQGRIRVRLGTRTLTIDDQYVTGLTAGTAVTLGGTTLNPTVNVQAASGAQPGSMAAADYTLLHTATALATANALVQRDATGNAAFNMVSIANTPQNATDGVNKAYADAIAAGFDPKGSVLAATTGVLPAYNYANGTGGVGATLTGNANGALPAQDGITLVVGNRLLVKNETGGNAPYNGIYVVTTVGAAGAPYVLTRATDFNTAASGPGQISAGAFITMVEQGTQAGSQWILVAPATIVVGTTNITWSQSNAQQAYTNGNGLSLTGNQFAVNLTGTNTLEFNAGALRVKSSATVGQALISGGTGVEPTYGALNLAGGASVVSGILPVTNGGLGVNTGAANLIFATPNGAAGAPAFRAIVAADLPTVGTAGTYPKVTVDAYGRVTAGAALLAADIPNHDFSKVTTGIVPLSQGGSGVNAGSYASVPSQVRTASVLASSNLTITAPGATIDSVAMVAGMRVLCTGQTTQSQNGLWVWNGAAVAMTRPADFATGSTTLAYPSMPVWVLLGTVYQGTGWYISTTGAITIDTTSIVFAAALTNISMNLAGTLAVGNGGTGATTPAGARTNLGAAGAAVFTITGNGAATSFVVAHNMASAMVQAKVTDPTITNGEVFPDIQYTDNNNLSVVFAAAPANGVTYQVRISG